MITDQMKAMIVALAKSDQDSALVDALCEVLMMDVEKIVQAQKTRDAAQAEATKAVLAKREAEAEVRRLQAELETAKNECHRLAALLSKSVYLGPES